MFKMTLQIEGYTIQLSEYIGHGAFGTVYKAKYKVGTQDETPVAAKRIVTDTASEKELEALYVWPRDHTNIVRIYHQCISEYRDVWIMMEFCDHGDLNNFASNNPTIFQDMPTKISLMHQMANGLAHIHNRNIVHRDIKPSNILIASPKPGDMDKFVAKLSDFALCKSLNAGTTMSSDVGTRDFKAPEFWDKSSGGKLKYRRSIDIFSMGLTFLSVIQPRSDKDYLIPTIEGMIFEGENGFPIGLVMHNREIYGVQPANIVVDSMNDGSVIKDIKSIIRRTTCKRPEERMTAAQILKELGIVMKGN